MNQERTRRLLLIAFAASLLIHIMLALKIEWPFAPPKEEVQTVRIEHARAIQVSRLPTPPPSTPPPQTPSPAPSATPAPAPKKASASGAGPTTNKAATPPTPAPTPIPTVAAKATPNCATTDTPVTLAATPPPPDIAPDARGSATNGTTKIKVTVNEAGAVTQAAVVSTSGNTSLDLVALTMARGAHYTPAMHACKAIASDYIFSAKFVAW